MSDITSEQERQALVTSLRLLAASPKSRLKIQEKLKARGFKQGVIERILSQLERQGYLNDRAFAEAVFQSLTNQRPSGRRRIAFELKKRGIKEGLIQELLEPCGEEEERERALAVAKEKAGRWQKVDRQNRRKKIYDFLVRRGFDYALSREVVEEVERGFCEGSP